MSRSDVGARYAAPVRVAGSVRADRAAEQHTGSQRPLPVQTWHFVVLDQVGIHARSSGRQLAQPGGGAFEWRRDAEWLFRRSKGEPAQTADGRPLRKATTIVEAMRSFA